MNDYNQKPAIARLKLWTIFFLCMGMVLLVSLAFVALSQYLLGKDRLPASLSSENPSVILALAAASQLIFLLVPILYLHQKRYQPSRVLGLRGIGFMPILVTVLAIFPLGILIDEFAYLLIRLFPSLGRGVLDQMYQLAHVDSVPVLILLFVVAGLLPGLGEEILFRGFMLRVLQARHGSVMAIILSSAVFGVVHLDPVQGASAGLLGVFLAWVALRSGSLLPPIVAHSANNTLAIASMAAHEEKEFKDLAAQGHDLSSLIIASLILAAFLYILVRMTRQPQSNQEPSPPREP